MPEMPEQETGAAAFGVRSFVEGRGGVATVFLGCIRGSVRFVRRSSGAGSVLDGKLTQATAATELAMVTP